MPYQQTDRVHLTSPEYYVDIDKELRVKSSETMVAMSRLADDDLDGKRAATEAIAYAQTVGWNLDGPHRVEPGFGCQLVHGADEKWPLDRGHFGLLSMTDLMVIMTAVNGTVPTPPTPEEAQDFPSA